SGARPVPATAARRRARGMLASRSGTGMDVFRRFFETIAERCIAAGPIRDADFIDDPAADAHRRPGDETPRFTAQRNPTRRRIDEAPAAACAACAPLRCGHAVLLRLTSPAATPLFTKLPARRSSS